MSFRLISLIVESFSRISLKNSDLLNDTAKLYYSQEPLSIKVISDAFYKVDRTVGRPDDFRSIT